MSAFTEKKIEYLQELPLGRRAMVNGVGEPHIGVHNLGKSKKFRDVGATERAALVVSDVLPGGAGRPREVEVRGSAEALSAGGGEVYSDFEEGLIRLYPERLVGWGPGSDAFRPDSRQVS